MPRALGVPLGGDRMPGRDSAGRAGLHLGDEARQVAAGHRVPAAFVVQR